MPSEAFSQEKRLLYRLCDFLIDKKLSASGKGIRRPMIIPLKEFSQVANPYSNPDNLNESELNSLMEELDGMQYERDSKNNKLLEVSMNLENSTDFINSFRNNKKIKFAYERQEIEHYKQKLEEGDSLREDRERFKNLKLELVEENWIFKYRGKTMSLKYPKKKIVLNICLLMFKEMTTFSIGDQRPKIFRDYENYKIGDEVDAHDILNILKQGEEIEEDSIDKHESIRHAVWRINNRSSKALGRKIFSYKDGKIKVLKDWS